MTKLIKIIIEHAREETACAWCGFPLDVGDYGLAPAAEDDPVELYCSSSCYRRHMTAERARRLRAGSRGF